MPGLPPICSILISLRRRPGGWEPALSEAEVAGVPPAAPRFKTLLRQSARIARPYRCGNFRETDTVPRVFRALHRLVPRRHSKMNPLGPCPLRSCSRRCSVKNSSPDEPWFQRYFEFRCNDCGSDTAYRSRRRNFSERFLLPIFLLQPVRCGECFRRDHRLLFVPVKDRPGQDRPGREHPPHSRGRASGSALPPDNFRNVA